MAADRSWTSAGVPTTTVITAEDRATRLALEKAETERRLIEAELKLAEAVKEVQRQRAQYGREDGQVDIGPVFYGRHQLCHHGDACFTHAAGSLIQSFLLAYGVRAGIGVLLHAFKLLRGRPASVLDVQLLLSERNLIIREEACRVGLLFGGFTGGYHFLRCLLRRICNRESRANSFIAGSVAGLSVFALDDRSRRRTFALYLLARVFQSAYNSAKAKGKWHFWGSHWQHGDTLLFALASAQVMYAYVMRPETVNESYWEFIVKTGPIAKPVLKAVRSNCRGEDIDLAELTAYIAKVAPGRLPLRLSKRPPIVPCSTIHPKTQSCTGHTVASASDTFKKTFPLYMSLTLVPFMVLNLQKFTQSPMRTLLTATRSAVRSTAFLSAFVGIYQGVICCQRKVVPKDHKATYFGAGLLAALAVLLEKKDRRSELALYVLPRAADSLWYILVNRRLIPHIHNSEVFLFCVCMGALMYYHEHEPDTMAPFLRGLITRFLCRTGIPDIPISPLAAELPPTASVHGKLHSSLESIHHSRRPSFDTPACPTSSPAIGSGCGSPTGRSGAASDNSRPTSSSGLKERTTSRELYLLSPTPEQAAEKLRTEAFQGLS